MVYETRLLCNASSFLFSAVNVLCSKLMTICISVLISVFSLAVEKPFGILNKPDFAVGSSSRFAVAQLFFRQRLASPPLEVLVTVKRVLVSHAIPTRFRPNRGPTRVSPISLV